MTKRESIWSFVSPKEAAERSLIIDERFVGETVGLHQHIWENVQSKSCPWKTSGFRMRPANRGHLYPSKGARGGGASKVVCRGRPIVGAATTIQLLDGSSYRAYHCNDMGIAPLGIGSMIERFGINLYLTVAFRAAPSYLPHRIGLKCCQYQEWSPNSRNRHNALCETRRKVYARIFVK